MMKQTNKTTGKKLNPLPTKLTSLNSTSHEKSTPNDIQDFISGEMKKLQLMKSTKDTKGENSNLNTNSNSLTVNAGSENLTISPNQTKYIKDSMKKMNLNNLPKPETAIKDDQLNVTSTKFEGFNKAGRQGGGTNSSENQNPVQSNELKTSMSTEKINISLSSKNEPFVIKKFTDNQNINVNVKEIINKFDQKKNTPNIDINTKDLTKPIVDDRYTLPSNKLYTPVINQPIMNDDAIEENYGDEFIKNDNELRMIEEAVEQNYVVEKIPKGRKVTASVTDVRDRNKDKEKDKDKDKDKDQSFLTARERALKRVKDLRELVNFEEESFNFLEIEYTERESEDAQEEEEEDEVPETDDKAIETLKIETTDSYTSMETISYTPKDTTKSKQDTDKTDEDTPSTASPSTLDASYQPLSMDAYKFVVKYAPYMEKLLLNNINKYILQNQPVDSGNDSRKLNKLDKDLVISEDILQYLFGDSKDIAVSFNYYVFFDTNPFLIAISVTLYNRLKGANSLFSNPGDEATVHLVMVYHIFHNKILQLFYSFSQVTNMLLLGNSENVIMAAKADGTVDLYDRRGTLNDKFYLNYETKSNITKYDTTATYNNITQSHVKLILPHATSHSIFSSPIVAMNKKTIDSKSKVYKIFAVDQMGKLAIFDITEAALIFSLGQDIGKFAPRLSLECEMCVGIERLFNNSMDIHCLKCIDMQYSKQTSVNDTVYIMTNLGLVKVVIEGRDDLIYNSLYTDSSNRITAFDLSDSGHFLLAFLDFTIKVFEEKNFLMIFQTYVNSLSNETVIDRIVWSNVICKNEKGKLTRKSLLANLYVLTTRNEFIIFDLNQKNAAEIKKVKIKKDLGAKQDLTKRNSTMAISDALFTDYSNYILQSNEVERKVEFHKLSLRKQYYDENYIKKANAKIIEKITQLQ